MLQNQSGIPATVDAKTAEEALALALRLQQERGERVSIEELQRTADEAGIDRIYLEGALEQVAKKAEQQAAAQVEDKEHSLRQRRRYVAMGIGMSVTMLLAVVGRADPKVFDSPVFIFIIVAAILTMRRAFSGTGLKSSERKFRGP